MTSRDFAFWLQGFFEISQAEKISADQVVQIKKHLALVFKHEIDPSMGDEKHQEELNNIHKPDPGLFKPNHNTFSPSETLLRC